MSTKTVESAGVEALPFFVRFLEDQSTYANSDDPPTDTPTDTPTTPLPFTYKFPSDWEDR